MVTSPIKDTKPVNFQCPEDVYFDSEFCAENAPGGKLSLSQYVIGLMRAHAEKVKLERGISELPRTETREKKLSMLTNKNGNNRRRK